MIGSEQGRTEFNSKRRPAMAAARVFPMGEAVQTITINSSFVASPQAIIYGLGTTVEFINNSGVAINITFVANPPGPTLFSNITNLANGASSSQGPINVSGSANYYVNVGATNYGPYAIQVGNGSLWVQVTSLDVDWEGVSGDPLSPVLQNVYKGMSSNVMHTAKPGATGSFTYTVATQPPSKPRLSGVPGSGGGTVKIQSA
jgi:plastocyanin